MRAYNLDLQLDRVQKILSDGRFHTLASIQSQTGDVQQSIASRIRDLRTEEFGGYTIKKKKVTDGVWAYRMVG